eukprot:3881463-Rhodomonas_salina.1
MATVVLSLPGYPATRADHAGSVNCVKTLPVFLESDFWTVECSKTRCEIKCKRRSSQEFPAQTAAAMCSFAFDFAAIL